MKVYSIDVKIWATAYIKAENEAEAQAIADALMDTAIYLPDDIDCGDVPISGANYNNLEADVSLSPAMTIAGPDERDVVDLVEDLDNNEGED